MKSVITFLLILHVACATSPSVSPFALSNPSASPGGPNGTTGLPTANPRVPPTTWHPSTSPTNAPTWQPSASPTYQPTDAPSTSPPTNSPTISPTRVPTSKPTTGVPTASPTAAPIVRACRPREGLNRRICENLIVHCARYGIGMKWMHGEPRIKKLTGRPPRCNRVRTKASGCQCQNYCGYKTPQGCNRDPLCTWEWLETAEEYKAANRRCSERRGQCNYKTGGPGYPISQCNRN